MSVSFEELEGSPSVVMSSSGTEAKRSFRVAWDGWQEFAEQLAGGWRRVGGQFELIEPLPFPGLSAVIVDRIEVVPMDPHNPRGDDILTLQVGTNSYPAAGARITVTYRSLGNEDTANSGEDKVDIIPGTILTYHSDLGAEYMTTPGRAWYWEGTGEKLPGDVNPGVLMPTGSYTLKWDRVANPPWAAIRSLRGKVNNQAFYNAAAGTVLFLGARASRKFEFMRNASLWKIEYAFAERAQPWNKFFKAGDGWTAIKDDPGGGGNPPYDSGDFNGLFLFGA